MHFTNFLSLCICLLLCNRVLVSLLLPSSVDIVTMILISVHYVYYVAIRMWTACFSWFWLVPVREILLLQPTIILGTCSFVWWRPPSVSMRQSQVLHRAQTSTLSNMFGMNLNTDCSVAAHWDSCGWRGANPCILTPHIVHHLIKCII